MGWSSINWIREFHHNLQTNTISLKKILFCHFASFLLYQSDQQQKRVFLKAIHRTCSWLAEMPSLRAAMVHPIGRAHPIFSHHNPWWKNIRFGKGMVCQKKLSASLSAPNSTASFFFGRLRLPPLGFPLPRVHGVRDAVRKWQISRSPIRHRASGRPSATMVVGKNVFCRFWKFSVKFFWGKQMNVFH